MRPISTYRLQFTGRFRFADACNVLPYLAGLGVSDCYSSPILKASPGSTHGYDICDHGSINPELGSLEEYEAWCAALHAHSMGNIVDFVPNHMSADPMANLWWRDVLENGPSSPFARYFDIDWDPVKPELKDKVLLPLLGDQYGRVLERGELRLCFVDGALHLRYFDQDLPINPRQAPRIIGMELDRDEQRRDAKPAFREFLSILTALQNLPPYVEKNASRIVERQREKEVARERLARLVTESVEIREHIDGAIRRANGVPGDRSSFNLLHTLLEHQAYRLAYWRTAVDEINYRRFFDINELVGLRMEEQEVFDATHGLIGQLIAAGHITGLRIDHPDGLFDPSEYFSRLQEMASAVRHGAAAALDPFYIVAEKILSMGETIRPDWPVAGTTGYGFLNLVSGLFIDGRQARALRRAYARVTGHQETFEEVVYQSKRTIMFTAMASELNVLAHALNRISERDRRYRDYTLNSCRRVLREVVACFPVYRTYVTSRAIDGFDQAAVQEAIRLARRRNPLMETSIFEFLEEILLHDVPSLDDPDGGPRLQFAMKVQQLSSPVQAKGVEDTAFYRYHVLASANEVGGHPSHLGVTTAEFHDANARRLDQWRTELITTATHDTKRGEDARVRINVISEMPDVWRRKVSEWMRINGRHRTRVNGIWAPDRNDEYLFYQALLGGWPAETPDAAVPERAPADLIARAIRYLQKAAREAKVHTSWIDEDPDYGRAVTRFIDRTLAGRTSARFLRSFIPFQRRVARVGMINSLAQLTLKLASPGVPDFYQGNELWDLSFVDPDNRGDVDFAARRRTLEQMLPDLVAVEDGGVRSSYISDLLTHWVDGRIKLFITAAGLRFRRRNPALVLDAAYLPLSAEGPVSENLVAFARHDGCGTLLVVVPRIVSSIMVDPSTLPIGEIAWASTRILLPEALTSRSYRHVFTGETVQPTSSGDLAAADVFRTSPVAILSGGAKH